MNTAYSENRKWKIAGLVFTIFYSLFSTFAVSVFGAFEDTDTGARPAALGGAYVALADDAQSLYYNPAGLARLRQREVTTEYSRLLTGLSDNSNLSQYMLAAGYPLKSAGTMAAGWKEFTLGGLYSERTLSLGYGQWLTQRLAAGVSIEQLYHSFAAPSTVVDDNGNIQNGTPSLFSQNGNSKGALSADFGLLYRLTDRQSLGLAVQDMNEPNVALDSGDDDVVPRTWRFGWAYQSARKLSLTTALTTHQYASNSSDYTVIGGAEKWWDTPRTGGFALRGALALGTNEFRQFSTGLGYRLGTLQLDYAFVFDVSGLTLGDTAGTHRFSLSYRFGPEPAPAMTPMGAAIEDLPVNILNVSSGSIEGESPFSLEKDSTTVPTQPSRRNP